MAADTDALAALLGRIDTGDPAAAIHKLMAEPDSGLCRFGSGEWQGISAPAFDVAGYGRSPTEAAEDFLRWGYEKLNALAFEGG